MDSQGQSPNTAQVQVTEGPQVSAKRGTLVWPIAIAISSVCALAIVVVIAFSVVAVAHYNAQASANQAAASALPLPPPPVPVAVYVRKAEFGEGYVLEFKNDGERHLRFTITHLRPSLGQVGKSYTMRLDPGKSEEIGWAEGSVFYPGDQVRIDHPDFSSREVVVNP